MIIEPGNVFYCHVSPEDAFEIVSQTVVKGEVIERLLYLDPVSGERFKTESEIPFYRAQDRQILSQNLMVDPCSIEDYIVAGGYSALTKVLKGIAPDEVIKEIESSGLRGRGAAASRPDASGTSVGKRPVTRSTWSAMRMKATPGLIWTGVC